MLGSPASRWQHNPDIISETEHLVLGMKGSMAEYELGLMRQRARQAFEAKIQCGHVMWEVPVGFIRTRDDRIEKSTDRQVQHAIAGVFQKFRELGRARQTMLWYREAQLPLPEVCPGVIAPFPSSMPPVAPAECL